MAKISTNKTNFIHKKIFSKRKTDSRGLIWLHSPAAQLVSALGIKNIHYHRLRVNIPARSGRLERHFISAGHNKWKYLFHSMYWVFKVFLCITTEVPDLGKLYIPMYFPVSNSMLLLALYVYFCQHLHVCIRTGGLTKSHKPYKNGSFSFKKGVGKIHKI